MEAEAWGLLWAEPQGAHGDREVDQQGWPVVELQANRQQELHERL
jgi:hypothetical protein